MLNHDVVVRYMGTNNFMLMKDFKKCLIKMFPVVIGSNEYPDNRIVSHFYEARYGMTGSHGLTTLAIGDMTHHHIMEAV